jgi:hypothetical protein
MRLGVFSFFLAFLLISTANADSRAADASVAEAMKRPRIAAALAARARMDEATIKRDIALIKSLQAPSIVLNGPNNRINDGSTIITNIAAGKVSHGSLERTIEYAAERGSDVILMGEEITTYEDRSVRHRRFTDIWTETPDGWKIVLRQATVYSPN